MASTRRLAIQAAFDRAAGSYDSAAFLQQEIARRLDERLELMKIQPRTILEAGCGTGYALPLLRQRYPELGATLAFRDLQAQLEGTENRITVERKRFNESVQAYNTARRQVPTNLYAMAFGLDEKTYFAASPGAEEAPKVEL